MTLLIATNVQTMPTAVTVKRRMLLPPQITSVQMVCGQFRVTDEMLRFWLGGTGSASVGGLVQGPFRVPRDVRVHWQSQCHPTVTFQSERHHAQTSWC